MWLYNISFILKTKVKLDDIYLNTIYNRFLPFMLYLTKNNKTCKGVNGKILHKNIEKIRNFQKFWGHLTFFSKISYPYMCWCIQVTKNNSFAYLNKEICLQNRCTIWQKYWIIFIKTVWFEICATLYIFASYIFRNLNILAFYNNENKRPGLILKI